MKKLKASPIAGEDDGITPPFIQKLVIAIVKPPKQKTKPIPKAPTR